MYREFKSYKSRTVLIELKFPYLQTIYEAGIQPRTLKVYKAFQIKEECWEPQCVSLTLSADIKNNEQNKACYLIKSVPDFDFFRMIAEQDAWKEYQLLYRVISASV